MAAVPFVIPQAPMPLPLMAAGSYGISHDIFMMATENDLPNGWNSYRGEHPTVLSMLNSLISD